MSEIEALQLTIPDHKIDKMAAYLTSKHIPHTKLERGILNTYPETSRGYTVIRINKQDLTPALKTQISKQLGKPLTSAEYQANWGANANCTTYTPGDVVMVTGNRASTALGQELLKAHFQANYLPLLQAAVASGASFLCGNDGGIDAMVRDYLSDLGYNLHLHSGGFWEAKRDDCAISVIWTFT